MPVSDQDSWIVVRGAREHNLKNIEVAIPKGALTVITGPSGSGKSSLALDILYTEGKRRYMESLSSYARQFLGVARKPDVDHIDGLCPAIAIEQKTLSSNPRSTVGTITEIYDHLRVLFARVGVPHCPECHTAIKPQSPQAITNLVLERFAGNTIMVVAPIAHEKKGEFKTELVRLFQQGFYRFRIDGQMHKFGSLEAVKAIQLHKSKKHTIDLLVDALEVVYVDRPRLNEAIERSFSLARGMCKVVVGQHEHLYSSARMCVECSESIPEIEPRFFSFNSPIGACQECHGLGFVQKWPWKKDDPDAWKSGYPAFFGPKYARELSCQSCMGARLNRYACAVMVADTTIHELSARSIKNIRAFFAALKLSSHEQEVVTGLVSEITKRLDFLLNIGLDYLTLDRGARTLSGGEGQRIRLATQIGSALSGVLYVLDEPSIGLHQRDNDRLIGTLKFLRDQGNTVVVVEHDLDTMRQADYIIDMGPAAGVRGGQVVAHGTPEEVAANKQSLSGAYLSGEREIALPKQWREPISYMTLAHATKHNLQDLTVKFPLGVLCGISGVSGSGKSSLIMDELVPALHRDLGGYARSRSRSARARKQESDLAGADEIEALVVIDQTPIGRTPRSNPATYLGIFDEIRKLFSSLPESNARGYKPGRFSFNVADGRCAECRGDGSVTVEMHFLPPVTMVCRVCNGSRYNQQTLEITYREKTIADVLAMTAWEACSFFKTHKQLHKRLSLLCDVGLDYLSLGQASTTLSGGEAQRIKLVEELAKRGRDTLYVLDEPTTGLHNSDIERLLMVLNRLVNKGNSMVIIEHNLDVLKTVDYLIDLGPEGGDGGGAIVAHGTPEQVARVKASHTGRYLAPYFE